ncbi:MAG: hypothetical protein H6837_21520 [Planctomycetes bacterium]|nr:hypothetical protein [Planctomycetota bacterium]
MASGFGCLTGRKLWVLLLAAMPCGSCGMVGPFIEYTDDLRDSKEHTVACRYTAKFGGFLGALAGVPIDAVALPVSATYWAVRRSVDQDASLSAALLFPSFVLLQVGSLLGAPVHLVEYVTYTAWRDEQTLTTQEREEQERKLDDDALPRYPVTPIYGN